MNVSIHEKERYSLSQLDDKKGFVILTMEKKVTEKIKLWGIVQGVGFRPFVAKCADKYNMLGEVRNIGGLVDIVVTDTEEKIQFFVERLLEEKPVPAEIVHIKIEKEPYREFTTFTILDSDDGDDEAAMIPSDLALCKDCLKELYDKDNPRYRHPFISCMVCGPRYTVIDRIPYDRHNTAMIDWPMCDFCEKEYTSRTDRRYHAQTISCHECGPVLLFKDNNNDNIVKDTDILASSMALIGNSSDITTEQVVKPIVKTADIIKNGGVVAMKGVGGYNLIADPLNPKAVKRLREIKKREQKPFAIMFKDINTVKLFCKISEVEEKLLDSSAKPIILLEHHSIAEIANNIRNKKEYGLGDRLSYCDQDKEKSQKHDGYIGGINSPHAEENNQKEKNIQDLDSLAEIGKSRFIGSFLPSMGSQHLLLDIFGLLIVTSANLSDMPIIKDEEEMFALMDGEPLIEGCLYNERDIRVRVDDSVVRVIDSQPQMIRRSKGYAPVPLYINADKKLTTRMPEKQDMILACGGQLKNSFAVSKGPFSYVSQYFGDLDSFENQQLYRENVERMSAFFRIEPGLVVCDLHPLYYTTSFAEEYSKANNNLPILKVQHHHAHVASVMAEHHLEGAVIGISMDGTGYGTDGAIWGGEVLLCCGDGFVRESHLKYVDMLGGDSSMKDAAKSAVCYQYAWKNGYFKENDGLPSFVEVSGEGKNSAALPADFGNEMGKSREFAVDMSKIMAFAEANGYPKCEDRLLVEKALENGINGIKSSSMGRLFDAVSALLGIKEYNDYEGQCAIMLEDAAARAKRSANDGTEVVEVDSLALDFHLQIADIICKEALIVREKYRRKGQYVSKVVLTGGVFQNKILMEESLALLRKERFDVYYNVSVSPNDGGIALGQSYIGLHHMLK